MATRVSNHVVAIDRACLTEQCGIITPFSKSLYQIGSNPISQKIELWKLNNAQHSSMRMFSYSEGFGGISGKTYSCTSYKEHIILCCSTGTHSSEAKEYVRKSKDCTNVSSGQLEGTGTCLCDYQVVPQSMSTFSNRGLAEACKFAYNDAKFVNEKAHNDIVLLLRGITRLNNRAREDVAVLGHGFLKIDARAREDTEKIDHGVQKAAHLHHIVIDNAQSKLKKVADQHWSDGALEADLRLVDFCVKRRAIEDAFMALKFVKKIHGMMVNKFYQQPQEQGSFSINDMMGFITLEKNGKALDLFPQEVTSDRITAIQEAYWDMVSAFFDADGIDYTDPEELELLVATLIDLDAMDGKSSVSLLAECSNSPDVSTRQALVNALAAAPSMWILGNAGMGALQRLVEDHNPSVAAAASKAIDELKQQWELDEGDSLRFVMNQYSRAEDIKEGTDSEAD